MSQVCHNTENMKSTETIRNSLFLKLGLTRVYRSQRPKWIHLIEPDGVRSCRRNIIALAGLLALAGLSGASPGNLEVLGIKPGEDPWGVTVICATALGVQFYWYCLKYYHLKEDGMVDVSATDDEEIRVPIDSELAAHLGIAQKRANFLSNWVAFGLTVVSLYFIVYWIVSAHAKGMAT